MKKLFLLLSFLAVNLSLAQETDKPVTTTTTTTIVSTTSNPTKKPQYIGKKDEFKLDPTYLIFAGALNLSYERVINEESGLGVSVILSNGKEINTTFSLTPYYRFYFGKKPAAGFFFEGFASINSFKYNSYVYNQNYNNGYYNNGYNYYEVKSTTDFAIGIGLGGKWITNNGIIFELSGGIGRNLLNDYSAGNKDGLTSSQKVVGRGGISIGYRF
ncbi:MAG: hypothetical protein H7174_10450 [Flavobacterium sp.]|nr:hypothetical protein [Flavobacterium sp.]